MDVNLPNLFSPIHIGTMTLKNRLVRSATYEAKADEDGNPTDLYIDFYRQLAEGGVGLIVTGLTYPEKAGKLPRTLRVDDSSCLPNLSRIATAIHGVGNACKVALQIGHTGRQLPHTIERETVAPSAIVEPYTGRMPREMKREEIESFIDKSAGAIAYAFQSGFDAVQVHAAHGWLLSSFLSPHTNHRTDLYGGSTKNRARILVEIIERAGGRVEKGFPVLIKMNACDYVQSGIELPEALDLGAILEEAGYAAMEISSGMWETITRDPETIGWKAERIPEARKRIRTVEDEAYHRAFTKAFKNHLQQSKVILVGGLKTPSLMEEIIASEETDLVSLSRPLIREPELPNQWLAGNTAKATCVSCNKCLDTLREENGLRCNCL